MSWDYNAAGDLTGVNDLVGSTIASAKYDYHYDAAGRLDKSLSTLAGMGSSQAVFQTHTRDALDRRTGLATTIGGTFNSTSFTVSGGSADISNTYVYDRQDRLRSVSQTSPSSDPDSTFKRVDLKYNDRGQISTIWRQSGTVGNYVVNTYNSYDGLGRQRRQLDSLGSWGPAYDWWYDDANRVTKEAQTFETNTLYFDYDATGQLTQTNSDQNNVVPDSNYVHDLAGNRQNVGDGIGTGNQLLRDADYEYGYDYEGNRTTRTRKDGASSSLPALTTYEYDFRNRLVRVTISATVEETATSAVEYTYDTLDRRVARREIHFESDGETIDTQVTEYYVYDEGSTRATPDGAHGSGDVLFDFLDADGSGSGSTPTLRRRYLTAVDHVFAQENLFVDSSVTNSSNPSGAPIGTYWLIQDRLGTVRTVIDNDKVVWNDAQFDAFGNRVGLRYPHGTPYELDSSLTRYGFTGQEYDELTELTWYSNGDGRGRWYDARTNNFIQPDAIGLADGPNVYSYVHNSPTNSIDPNGQQDFGHPDLNRRIANMWGALVEWWGGGRVDSYESYAHQVNSGTDPSDIKIVTQPPDGKMSGVIGGIAETVTLRQCNLLTAYPTPLQHLGAISGEESVPFLGSGLRVWNGTDVYDGERSRVWAAIQFGSEVVPVLQEVGPAARASLKPWLRAPSSVSPGSLLLGPDDAFLKAARTVTPRPGYYDVSVHGNANSVGLRTTTGEVGHANHRALAQIIRRQPDYQGQPIRLIACETGLLPRGFAQNLSNKMGVEVFAPNSYVWPVPRHSGVLAMNAAGQVVVINPKPGSLLVTRPQWHPEMELDLPTVPPTGQWQSFAPGGNSP